MKNNLHQMSRDHWLDRGFKNLLVWFFVYLVIGPFLEDLPYANRALNLVLAIVLISALRTMSGGSRRLLVAATGLLVVELVLEGLQFTGVFVPRLDLAALVLAGFLMLLVYSFSKRLFQVSKVDTNVICAALCLYLVIGLLWGAFYTVLESVAPGSFAGKLLSDSGSPQETTDHLQYFSFVTLSTLGYGDITPQTRGAAALCQAEAILGQFLTVVLVARLVGIQVAQEASKSDNADPNK